MRFFAVLLTMSVGLGCAASNRREARSPDEENNEEITDSDDEESSRAEPADADDYGEDRQADEEARPKKRKPKRRSYVEAAPREELPPMYKKPLPPEPAPPPPVEEPASATATAYGDGTDQGDSGLEAEARKRCRWKNVAPYRPDWANSISPPLAQQRKITSKPICPYGTPPAVLRVARQIAVQQTKLKRR